MIFDFLSLRNSLLDSLYVILWVPFPLDFLPIIDISPISEILEIIQKDIKTLEKAVYSESSNSSVNLNNESSFQNNSEDVLTRHLLKLSEIENQFQQLTNRFEEINFKLDKLSNRLSKVQADNQVRFQDIENVITSEEGNIKLSKKKLTKENESLPGSSTHRT